MLLNIYFNGRFLTQRITGVQRYAAEMLKAYDENLSLHPAAYVHILLLPPGASCGLSFKNIKTRYVGVLHGHAWEQLELPIYARDGFLINFANCAPILKQNQAVVIHDAAVAANPAGFSLPFRVWYRIMFFFLRYQAKLFFTVSDFSKKELHHYFGIPRESTYVTYNGLDHAREILERGTRIPKRVEGMRYILAVGSLNPNKNFSLILRIAERLSEYNFVIAGGGNESVFQQKIYKAPSNVHFLGYVKDEELFALYAEADCFLFPSLYEGFGIPPLEAMMCGCPVVVSDCASLPEVCQDAAIYCHPQRPDEWVSAIKSILQMDDSKKKIMRKKAEAVVERYQWRLSADKMANTVSRYIDT